MRLETDYQAPNLLQIQDVVVKAGPRAWKSAAILTFGDKLTGEVTSRKLRVQTWWRKPSHSGYGFEAKSDLRWSCEGDEIQKLLELLRTELPAAGTYVMYEETSAAATAARLAADDTTAAAAVVVELLAVEKVRTALAMSGAAESGAALVTRQRQRSAVERLQHTVANSQSSEQDLQDCLSGEWWLFGGRFIGQHQRRQITALDQIDIPLLRADGSLHIVELKRAAIPKLVTEHRNHLVPGPDVHMAVGQTMNYLRAVDEQHFQIRHDFGIEVRRATATVVIGHPDHCPTYSQEDIAETFRTYNSHLARIEVVSYADLLSGAYAALNVREEEGSGPSDAPQHNETGAAGGPSPKPQRRTADSLKRPRTGDPWAVPIATNPWGPSEGDDTWAATDDRWADEPPF